jgi:aconitate hydratase
MGILALQFKDGMSRQSLKLDGTETFDITGVESGLTPRKDIDVKITCADGSSETIQVMLRIDTLDEVEYYKNGGILQYVLRSMIKQAA